MEAYRIRKLMEWTFFALFGYGLVSFVRDLVSVALKVLHHL